MGGLDIGGENSKGSPRRLSCIKMLFLKIKLWNSMVVQWLSLGASNAEGAGLIPGQGTKIPHAI